MEPPCINPVYYWIPVARGNTEYYLLPSWPAWGLLGCIRFTTKRKIIQNFIHLYRIMSNSARLFLCLMNYDSYYYQQVWAQTGKSWFDLWAKQPPNWTMNWATGKVCAQMELVRAAPQAAATSPSSDTSITSERHQALPTMHQYYEEVM